MRYRSNQRLLKPNRTRGYRKLEEEIGKQLEEVFLEAQLKVINKTRLARLKTAWRDIRPIPRTKASIEDFMSQIEMDLEDESLEFEEQELEDIIDDEIEELDYDYNENEVGDLLKVLAGTGLILATNQLTRSFNKDLTKLGNKVGEKFSPLDTLELPDDDLDEFIDTSFDTEVGDFIRNYSLETASTIVSTQKEMIKRFLYKNVIGDSDENQLKRSIQLLKGMNKSRASTIALTELSRIQSFSSKYFSDKNGITQWEVICNEPNDLLCIEVCGNVVPIGEDLGNGFTSPPFHPNRFSEDTELLTKKGWKLVTEVTKSDLFLSIDKEFNREFVKVDIISHHDHAIWHHYLNEHIDIMISDDHQMYIVGNDGCELIKSRDIRKDVFYIPTETKEENIAYIKVDKTSDLTIIKENKKGVGITLEKNHTLFMRRNGKSNWIGNCQCSVVPYLGEIDEQSDEEIFEEYNE